MKAVRLTAFLGFWLVPAPPLQADFEEGVFLRTDLSVSQQKSYCSFLPKLYSMGQQIRFFNGKNNFKIITCTTVMLEV